MLSEHELDIIRDCARKYKASRVLLFGSSLGDSKTARDIDLAVDGVLPEEFFKFYGELTRRLTKPVDVIRLAERSLFIDLVRESGQRIYG